MFGKSKISDSVVAEAKRLGIKPKCLLKAKQDYEQKITTIALMAREIAVKRGEYTTIDFEKIIYLFGDENFRIIVKDVSNSSYYLEASVHYKGNLVLDFFRGGGKVIRMDVENLASWEDVLHKSYTEMKEAERLSIVDASEKKLADIDRRNLQMFIDLGRSIDECKEET